MALSQPQLYALLHSLEPVRTSVWLTGGVAVDFLLGRWTREHKDLDLIALSQDRAGLESELIALRFQTVFDSGWNTRWSFHTESGPCSDLEIVFVEPLAPDTGTLVIAPDDRAGARPGRYPLLPYALAPERRACLEGITFRICSAEYEWWARTRSATLVPGRTLEPKIAHDLGLLETLVPAERRAALLASMA